MKEDVGIRMTIEPQRSLLDLLDTAPQCQSFRDRLDETGKAPADVPLDVEVGIARSWAEA